MSKAFDCIPHDLLVAKLHAYGLSMDAITFMYLYMKRRKHGVKINDAESLFNILFSGVHQRYILGPILFNSDLLFFINEVKIASFADDNTIYASKLDLNELLRLLEKESEAAIKWFSDKNMIVNPKKLQAIIINRQDKSNHNCCLTINNAEIKAKELVTLLSIEIDNKLNSENHVSKICKKANNQLNAISRIGAVLEQKEKEILIKSFVYSNFNYGPLIWHITTQKEIKKVEKFQEKCLKFILRDYDKKYFQL